MTEWIIFAALLTTLAIAGSMNEPPAPPIDYDDNPYRYDNGRD